MKTRIQFNPALTAALLCAAGWVAFWLLAVRPAPPASVIRPAHPEVTRLVADEETLKKLKTPTLFALPSEEGFSGRFLENRVDLPLTLEKPSSPIRNLPRETAGSPGVNQTLLMEKTATPQNALPIPGVAPETSVPPVAVPQLFLPPELKGRAGTLLPLRIATAGLPETVRVNLAVRPDGTVGQVFFDTPITNTALLGAIRLLPFKPARETTEGWLDIRFPQEGSK